MRELGNWYAPRLGNSFYSSRKNLALIFSFSSKPNFVNKEEDDDIYES